MKLFQNVDVVEHGDVADFVENEIADNFRRLAQAQ